MTAMLTLSNNEAEQQLLGCLLANNNILKLVADLVKPDDFYDPVHGKIFAACKTIISEGSAANAVTLKNFFADSPELQSVGGAVYLAKLEGSVVSFSGAKDYAALISDLAKRRSLLDISQRMNADLLANDYENPATSIAATYASQMNAAVAGRSERSKASSIIADMIENDRPAVTPTGYTRLDKAFEGGLYAGKFYAIAARMKAGKTALLASIAYNTAKAGSRVLYIALEMGGREIMQRIVARHLGCNAIHIARSEIDTNRMNKAKQDFETIRIDFDDAPVCTVEDIIAKIMAASGKYDGVIIDYIQLIGGQSKGENEAAFHARIAQLIAATCKRCPSLWVLTAAQLNREGEVRGSDGLRMAADMLLKLETIETGSGVEAWLEMEATRYTANVRIGSQDQPALSLNQRVGPYYQEI